MLDEKQLMLKFLKLNFPTYRIKDNQRFKRAIVLDDGPYFLSNEGTSKEIYFKLMEILELVFNFKKTIIADVLKTFLNLK